MIWLIVLGCIVGGAIIGAVIFTAILAHLFAKGIF